MHNAHVRTLPHFVPWLRAWRPVKMKILICDSQRERVNISVSLEDVRGCFSWPFGPSSINIICWKDANSGKDICEGEITIWPRASGKPRLLITSSICEFQPTMIVARDIVDRMATFHSIDGARSIDDKTYRIRRAKHLVRVVGAPVLGVALCLVTLWSFNQRLPEPIASSAAELVVEATKEIAPPIPATPATQETVKRVECSFIDPERTQDENGKVAVMCDGQIYQATATYKGEGRFDFTDLATP